MVQLCFGIHQVSARNFKAAFERLFFEIESLWLFIFLNALDLLATQVPNN